MMRLTKGWLCLGLLLGHAGGASAFSLLGPFKVDATVTGLNWQAAGYGGQPAGLGYNINGSIGGPMYPFEAYRWNVPTITYAYDFSFLRYFGPEGVNAVEQAIAILNALPPASQMSPTLSEFALDTRGDNDEAAVLGLRDVKSYTLAVLLEEMGLANPHRFVWNLRTRETGQNFTNYTVIQLNHDPVTIEASRYVNGTLYNYQIFDALGPQGGEWASAVEWYQLDPLYQAYSAVAGAFNDDLALGSSPSTTLVGTSGGLAFGQFFSGLTRDDVGGLRFLLSTNHMVFDTLLPTVLPRASGAFSSPWAPVLNSNFFGSNITGISNIIGLIGTNLTNAVRTALRPGVDKITFQRVPLLGTNFNPITLRYTDRYINPTNGRIVKQPVERLVVQPDIIFTVSDLGTVDEVPFIFDRSPTTAWINNAAINTLLGGVGLGGPGTITPPVVIQFSDTVPYFFNFLEGGGDINSTAGGAWGSFDGTDRPPVVFPIYQNPLTPGFSLEYLQDVILRPN